MTGYGTGSVSKDNYEIITEIKTLNSKFADITVRIPNEWSSFELIIRKQVIDALIRGKINVSIEVNNKASDATMLFDEQLLNEYYKQFKNASENLKSNETNLFGLALHAPGVLKANEVTLVADISEIINKSVGVAIANCDKFRIQEGDELRNKLLMYIQSISDLSDKIDPFDKKRISKIEEKIKISLDNISLSVDSNRFEQEMIYYIEKLDISEEKVRLANHLSYFIEVVEEDQPNGKKLGFIGQEIGREINTIGSKANDAYIQRIVVEMKEELEKIKEQVLNVL